MLLAVAALIVGLALLVWSADKFVEGAAATAHHLGMSALMIGVLIIGFGTSAPEIVVSIIAALDGSPGLAVGNGFGSNITNIGLVLGLTALITPLAVKSSLLKSELPLLAIATLYVGWTLLDLNISRLESIGMLVLFAVIMVYTTLRDKQKGDDNFAEEVQETLGEQPTPLQNSVIWLLVGLVILTGASHLLVWAAIKIATFFGVSDLIIGLTIVAIGTSLPELAASLAAIRKNEHDLAMGNVIGSNLFNTLVVVGLAGSIHPLAVDAVVLHRDWLFMSLLTLSLFILGYGVLGRGRINRVEGGLLCSAYVGYLGYLYYLLS